MCVVHVGVWVYASLSIHTEDKARHWWSSSKALVFLARLARELSVSACCSLQCWVYRYPYTCLAFCMGRGIQFQTLTLAPSMFNHWNISPVSGMSFCWAKPNHMYMWAHSVQICDCGGKNSASDIHWFFTWFLRKGLSLSLELNDLSRLARSAWLGILWPAFLVLGLLVWLVRLHPGFPWVSHLGPHT